MLTEYGDFSTFLQFHLLRFPVVGGHLYRQPGDSLAFRHQISPNLHVDTFYRYRTGFYGVKVNKKSAEINEHSSTMCARGDADVAYCAGSLHGAHTAAAYWGCYDAVKLLIESRRGEGSTLMIAALFPQEMETWCQLLGDPSIGIRKHFSTENSLSAIGMHTVSGMNTLFTISVFRVWESLTLFFWSGYGRATPEELFLSLKRSSRHSTEQLTLHRTPRGHTATASTCWQIGGGLAITMSLRIGSKRAQTGLAIEVVD